MSILIRGVFSLARCQMPATFNILPVACNIINAVGFATNTKKTDVKQSKEIPRPRPQSVYTLYVQENLPKLCREDPETTTQQLMKVVAANYKALKPEELRRYQEQFDKLPHPVKPQKERTRAPSAYNLYVKEEYSNIRGSLPDGAPTTAVMKAAADRFKTLSPAGKKKYEEEANKLKAEVAAVREAKKAGKPKRAPTAYTCFVQQNYRRVHQAGTDVKPTEVLVKLGQQWKGMSESEQARYKPAVTGVVPTATAKKAN